MKHLFPFFTTRACKVPGQEDSGWPSNTGVVILVFLSAVAVTVPTYLDPPPAGHDRLFHLSNAHEYACILERGTVVAHVTPNYYNRLGGLNFKYYSPYAYLPVACLMLAGVPVSLAFAVSITLSFFLSGLGMYCWMRILVPRPSALIAAGLYMVAPYHIDDLIRRFAYPELWGMACLPWVFWAAERALRARKPGLVVPLAALLAATGLIHNLSGLMAALLLLFYLLLRAGPGLRSIIRLAATAVLTILFGAFYMLPAILEMGEIALVRQIMEATDNVYRGLDFSHLFRVADFGPLAIPSPGLWFLLLGAWGSAVLIVRDRREGLKRFALPVLIAITLFLCTKSGAAVMQKFKLLGFLQFPWRFLGPASLLLACAAGRAASWAAGRPVPTAVLWLLVVATTIFSFGNGLPERRSMVDRKVYARFMVPTFLTGDHENKYLPLGMFDARDRTTWFDLARTIWMAEGEGVPRLLENEPEEVRFTVEGAGPNWVVILRRSYTSGWTTRVAEGHAETDNDPETGLMRVRGEGVSGPVQVQYSGTPVFQVSMWISMLTVILSAGWMAWPGQRVSRHLG